MSERVVFFALDLQSERLSWRERQLDIPSPLINLDSDAFAALCIAVRRAANEREKVNGYRVKLEGE